MTSRANYDGLTRLRAAGTWSPQPSTFPIVLDKEIRGGLRFCTNADGDTPTNIPGAMLQDGMLVFVSTTAGNFTAGRMYQYRVLDGESRDTSTGTLPNNNANWSEFATGGVDGLNFEGNASVDDDDDVPASANNGDIYANDSTGNYSTDWARIVDGVTTDTAGVVGDLLIYTGADNSTTYADDSWVRVGTGGTALGLWTRDADSSTISPNTAGDNLGSIGNITGNGGMIIAAGGTGNANVTIRAQGTGAVNIEAVGDGTIALNENTTVTGTLTSTGNFTSQGNSTLGNETTDTTTISGPATCNQTLSVTGNTTLNGNTTLGNAAEDTVTVTGTMTVTPNATFNNRVTADNFITTPVTLTATDGTATPDFAATSVFRVDSAITTMAEPQNLVEGQSGIFVLTGDGAINGWNNVFHFAGGSFTAPTNPAIIPYYVQNATADSERIYIGTPTGDIHLD